MWICMRIYCLVLQNTLLDRRRLGEFKQMERAIKGVDEDRSVSILRLFRACLPPLQAVLADGNQHGLDPWLMTVEEYREHVEHDDWKVEQLARVLNTLADDISASSFHCAASDAIIKETVKVS